MLVPDEIRKCAAFLCYKADHDIKLAGTTFFVGTPMVGTNGIQFVYLVTARHIIDGIRRKSTDQMVYVRVNMRDKPAQLVKFPIERWLFHPQDAAVDVAITPWAPPADVVDYLTIPVSMAATDEVISREGIGIGDEVCLTGLFVNHYGQQRNLPIVRIGNIALMPEEPVQTQDLGFIDAFLVEARSIGGLSGSPVFVHLAGIRRVGKKSQLKGSVFYWLGLMHGHWDLPVSDIDALVKDTLSNQRVNMGIAIVVPVSKILEVLNRGELTEVRKREGERMRKEKTKAEQGQKEEVGKGDKNG